jgi:sugar-specific transcriptional regulator TrmB
MILNLDMEERIKNLLRSIGLGKNEVAVYMNLAGRKSSSALEITNRTKLHKANTYDALNSLIEKGFVVEISQDKKRSFRALDPKKIVDYLKQKHKEAEEIIPFMRTPTHTQDEGEEVSTSKGLFASRNALSSLLQNQKPIYVFGVSPEISEILGEGFLKEFHKQRTQKKIPMKLIFNNKSKEEILRLNNLLHTEARLSGVSTTSLALTYVCNNTVLHSVLNPISVIEIRNKEIAEAYRSYFDALWKKSKKVEVVGKNTTPLFKEPAN